MIGLLEGVLVYKKPPELLLQVQGVGYEVFASMQTFYTFPEVGEKVVLFTHLVVREDAHVLYGFSSTKERDFFRALIKVNGVGPKSALAILSGITAEEFGVALQQEDITRLTKLPGIGKKTAERLLIEMRDRWDTLDMGFQHDFSSSSSTRKIDRLAQQEALSALIALGYKSQEAVRVLQSIADIDQLSSESIIRAALKSLMK